MPPRFPGAAQVVQCQPWGRVLHPVQWHPPGPGYPSDPSTALHVAARHYVSLCVTLCLFVSLCVTAWGCSARGVSVRANTYHVLCDTARGFRGSVGLLRGSVRGPCGGPLELDAIAACGCAGPCGLAVLQRARDRPCGQRCLSDAEPGICALCTFWIPGSA